MNLQAKLKELFHLESFRMGQEETISSILDKEHTLAMLPTGTGKSLCYQFPGKLLDGVVIIISPLLSLMQDQVEQMKMKGEKRVVALNSFLSPKEKKAVLENLHLYKYLFISPEMISLKNVLSILKRRNISLFVVDEAHCISQWGYDFRPDYQKLGEVRQELNNPLTLALTATATETIRKDIIRSLHLENVKEIVYSVNRPNITIKIEELSSSQEKMEQLLKYVQEINGQGIVYFSSKKMLEQIATYLKKHSNKRIMSYHGGMAQEDRILVQQQYQAGQLDVICATSAFGMGINKEDIRFIIHYHMPTKMEAFIQEIGRAGRDGNQSISILLYAPGDEKIAYQLVEGELASDLQVDQWSSSLRKYDDYSQWNNQEEKYVEQYFTETQWRVLKAFIKPENKTMDEITNSLEKYKDFRTTRIQEKTQKIQGLLYWIHSKECRRKYIASYFGEVSHSQNVMCCDRCGFDISFFMDINESITPLQPLFEWKEQLALILNIK